MATITTTTPILDSAGNPARGMIYWRQQAAYTASAGFVTTWPGKSAVRDGEWAYGNPVIPTTPDGQFVQVAEVFGHGADRTTRVWWTHITGTTIDYADLP